jgi:hypothetical protein
MVIELGEADVFEGKISEAVERLFDAGAARADFVEQRFNLRAIHQDSFAALAA